MNSLFCLFKEKLVRGYCFSFSSIPGKNQLASDGPDSIKLVVIPALTTMLDSSLVDDKSLCPVRALKVYLDKTKSMRTGKALLFVSLREGYSKDITRIITISQWIKQTIHTCYQSSDMTDQQVTQVRAHDVRAMAASLLREVSP